VPELVEEGAAADAEGFGGFGAVEVVVPQRLEDGFAFDCFELPGIGGQGSARVGRRRRGRALAARRKLGLVARAGLAYSRRSFKIRLVDGNYFA
jgi:hypothetical protein